MSLLALPVVFDCALTFFVLTNNVDLETCGISLLLLPFASRKTTLEKSMRKKNTKKYLIYKIIFCILRTALKHGALVFTSTHQLKERHRDLPMSLSRSPKNLPDNPPPAIRFKCSAKVKWNDARLGGLEFIFQLKLEDVYMFMQRSPCILKTCKPWITHPEPETAKTFLNLISQFQTNFPPSRSPFSPKSCLLILGSASLHEVSSGRLCLTLCLEVYCRLYYSISLM